VRKRVGEFWEKEIVLLPMTDAIVLIVTHGGIIGRLREYLNSQNWQLYQSETVERTEWRKAEVSNCSITEIIVDTEGRWKVLRAGDCDHLKGYDSKLENSTGEV
jgi:broad specificity phosphatase PhoE